MKTLLKQVLGTLFVLSYIVLLLMFVKVNTEYTMYKTFTEKGIKINNIVPCNLPPLT